ncbi:MAG: hypothetical protein HUU15_03715 [Candidatus Brocadiae bacterium]|nr:hypothetical protein [Candidatus Brocadiia bacterium]
MKLKFLLAATLAALVATPQARAGEPDAQSAVTVAMTPFVAIEDVNFFRSYEDAFPKARRDGKLVLFYRMLGDLDGLT